MPTRARGIHFPLAIFLLFACPQLLLAAEEPGQPDESGPYPLGFTLRLLERDLSSKDYAVVLETMIPTDLEAEWKRVATADNHETFLAQHGGKEKVLADPALKAAWERRVKIADGFLDLMRAAYKKRNITPPFDKGERIDFLAAGAAAGIAKEQPVIAVRVVLPAAGAEKQWPRLRGPTGQGTALESNFPLRWSETENIVWKTEIPGRGNGSPIIWDQRCSLPRPAKTARSAGSCVTTGGRETCCGKSRPRNRPRRKSCIGRIHTHRRRPSPTASA